VNPRFVHSVEYDFFKFCRLSSHPAGQTDPPTYASNTVLPSMPPPSCTVANDQSDSVSSPPPIDAKTREEKRYTLPNHKAPRFTPFTSPWVAARLKDDPDKAVSILNVWSHPRRQKEINRQTVDDINLLGETEAIEAIEELKNPRRFVRGTKGMKLELDANIMTLDSRSEHKTRALLDSGCEGSCIDVKYVHTGKNEPYLSHINLNINLNKN
jgi:hypothetical protein